jgi:ATP-dependent DNA helicase RecQ
VCDGALPTLDFRLSRGSGRESRVERRESSGDRQTIEQAILTVVREAEPSLGRTRAVEILRGGRSKVVRKYSYDALPGYGEFDDWRADDLLREVDALIDGGMLRSTGGRFPKLALTARAA